VEDMREAREVGGQRLRYAEAAAWGGEAFTTIHRIFLNLLLTSFQA